MASLNVASPSPLIGSGGPGSGLNPAELQNKLEQEFIKLNSKGETVKLNAESIYHSSIYMILLKLNWKSFGYMVICTCLLALQLTMLIGFAMSFFNNAVQSYIERLSYTIFDQLGMFFTETRPEFIARALIRLLPDALDPKFAKIEQTTMDYVVVFAVSGIVAFNILQEIQECFITDKMILNLQVTKSCSFLVFYSRFLNLCRRTFLSVFVSITTGLVMQGAVASAAILNGLAIFSILELDNLLFRVLLTDFVQEHMKNSENSTTIQVSQTEAWYIRLKSGLYAIACFVTITVVAMRGTLATETIVIQFSQMSELSEKKFTSDIGKSILASTEVGINVFVAVSSMAFLISRITNAIYVEKIAADNIRNRIVTEISKILIFVCGMSAALFFIYVGFVVFNYNSEVILSKQLGVRGGGLQGYIGSIFTELQQEDFLGPRCIWETTYRVSNQIGVRSACGFTVDEFGRCSREETYCYRILNAINESEAVSCIKSTSFSCDRQF